MTLTDLLAAHPGEYPEVERTLKQYGPGSYGRALNWGACANVFARFDAALDELAGAVEERDQDFAAARAEVERLKALFIAHSEAVCVDCIGPCHLFHCHPESWTPNTEVTP